MTRLTGSSTFKTSVGGRIYDGKAPPGNNDYPIAVVIVVDDPDNEYFEGTVEIDAVLQIDIIGRSEGGAAAIRNIAGQLNDRLHGAALTISGYTDAVAQELNRGKVIDESDELRMSPEYAIKAS